MANISVTAADFILSISMNRPEKRNAFTPEMYLTMANALEAVSSDESIKVVVIEAQGEHFSAGNDLSTFASIEEEEQMAETVQFMHALMDCPVPVVAKVRGQAVGIGTTLLLHCDLVFCDSSAQFCLPFINLALVPEFASSLLLPQRAGYAKAAQWLMTGEPFDAEEAKQGQLVNQIVAAEELDHKVSDMAKRLASKPRAAMRKTKALMKQGTELVKSHMGDELDVFFNQLTTEPAKEAFAAFLERRAPDPAKYQ